jgi:hypothetical protein
LHALRRQFYFLGGAPGCCCWVGRFWPL